MKGLVLKNTFTYTSATPRMVNHVYYCSCGTISKRSEPNPAMCKKEEIFPLDPFVCTCGQSEFASEFELNDVTLKEDEERIAVVALGMNYRAKMLFDGSQALTTCRLKAWRETEMMTFNKKTGRLYLISFPSGRIRYFNRVGLWETYLGGRVMERPEAWPHLLRLSRVMAERLPEYVLREWGIDMALFSSEPILWDPSTLSQLKESWTSQFERLAVLNGYPHLHFMGGRNILLSDVPATRRRLQQATGKTDVYQALSKALSPANIRRFERVLQLHKGRPYTHPVFDLLPQLRNPDICRQLLDIVLERAKENISTRPNPYSVYYDRKDIINPLPVRQVQRFRKTLGIDQARYERLILEAVSRGGEVSRVFMYLRDSVSLLNTIVERPDGTTDASYERAMRELSKVKGSLQTIHDELSRILDELESEDRFLPVHKKDTDRYDRMVGDLSFRVVRSTHELATVGRNLRNCVGGYQDRIFAGETLIIAAWREDRPVICISVENTKLQEVKLYGNAYPETDSPETGPLVEWLHLTRHASDATRDLEGIRAIWEGEREAQAS